MNSGNEPRDESGFAILFSILAGASWGMTYIAPRRPDETFIGWILVIVVATLAVLFYAKMSQPKPINWLTGDFLFGYAFCAIHFTYFFYWISGAIGSQRKLWYISQASCPHTVCVGLAMYACAVNCFLAGYYFKRTHRWLPIINVQRPPEHICKRWGKLGRLLVRIGCLGFCAFIAIIGPATFFGKYSGTNNISFVANIFYILGQGFVMSGITIAMAARQRIVERSGRGSKWTLGTSFFDATLIAGLCGAIAMHGDRSTMLLLGGAWAVSYSEYIKPVSFRTLAVAGFALVFLLGFIVAVRSSRSNTYEFDPITNLNRALLNMGTSSVCGFVAIDFTERNDYSYGWMQVKQLLGIVPFGRRIFGIGDTIENSSSQMLTFLIHGKVGKGQAGTGTSAFADTYFDFGLYGSIIIFFAVGMIAKTIQNRARSSTSIIWQVVLVNLVTFLAICSRYTFADGLIRTVLYSGIYTWVVCFGLSIPIYYRIQRMSRMPQQ